MSDKAWLSADEQRAWRTYLEATHLLWDSIERQLQRDSELSHSDYEILVRLSEAPERSLRMSELAAILLFSRSRLSHAVARLERQGWVLRQDCPTDRRGTVAVLSETGFAKLADAAPGHAREVRRALFAPLSPEQRQAFEEISAAVRDHLTEHE